MTLKTFIRKMQERYPQITVRKGFFSRELNRSFGDGVTILDGDESYYFSRIEDAATAYDVNA